MEGIRDLAIIGAGPAGLTAALYAGRARLSTLLLEKEVMGGQVMDMDMVENYPGFENGVLGSELASKMMGQVSNLEIDIQLTDVHQIQLQADYKVVRTDNGDYLAKAIIIASGANPKKLGVPGEDKKGVFYCAVCDGNPYADKVVAVAGGGDAGLTEGLYLSRIASRVIIIEVMPELNATRVLCERAMANPKIEIMRGTKIEEISGDAGVKEINLFDVRSGKRSKLAIDGVLVHVGLETNTSFLKGAVPMDEQGQILVNEKLATGVPGIFAAGDVRHGSPRQIVTAVGDGATAALSAQKYLNSLTC